MEELKKSPPWETFYNEVVALFDGDEDVKVVKKFTDSTYTIELLVIGESKAHALTQMLPAVKTFGNVSVDSIVRPSNDGHDVRHLLMDAFNGNPNVEFIETATIPGGAKVNYVVMGAQIVQFFDDNLMSCYGAKTMLLEDAARDIFNEATGVYYCTEEI